MHDQYAKFQLSSLKNKVFHEVTEGLQDVLLSVHPVPGGRLIHIFQLLYIMYDQYAKFQLCSLKNKIFHELAEGLQDVLLGVHPVPGGRSIHIFSIVTHYV